MLSQVSKTAALAAAAALLSDAVEAAPSKLEAAKGGSSSRKGDGKSVKCALSQPRATTPESALFSTFRMRLYTCSG